MGSEDRKKEDFSRIDPEDYLDFEERFIEKSGGGKGSGAGKGKKTLKEIKAQARKTALEGRKLVQAEELGRSLKAFADSGEEKILTYLNWVNQNLRGDFKLDPGEIQSSYSRSSGPGGQNVNKRETKVILIHKPTSFQVMSDKFRSQGQNRQAAQKRIERRLREHLRDWRSLLGPDQELTRPSLMEILNQNS